MDFGLTDDQRDIQRTARDLLAERAKPERVREHAEAHTTDKALWKELCELGWPGIAISEENGGQGLGAIELSILCEELGRVLLASGETIGALAGAVDGTAELVVGGAEAGVIVLVEEDGSGRLLTPEDAEVSRIAAIDPTRSAARVSAEESAGEALEDGCPGLGHALVAVSSELVGVCARSLEMTLAYVKERKQFGVPVGAYQAVSHRCAQMLLDTEKARSTTAFAAWSADAGEGGTQSLSEAAAMAKAAASDAGREVTASAIQAHGGIGFTWEADVHWLFKRAQIDAVLLGGAGRHRAHLAAILARRAGALSTAGADG